MYQQQQQVPPQAGGKKQKNRVTLALQGFRVSLKAKLFFPYIFQPKQEPGKKPRFSCMVMWDANDPTNAMPVQQLEAKLAEIKNTYHSTIHELFWSNPLKDFSRSQRQDGKPWGEMYQGKKWINCSNTVAFAPDIRVKNPDGTIRNASIADEILAYDGADVLVSLSFFGLDGENQGKYGVSANFDVLILLGTGEKVHIASGVDVNEAFGQFASIMGLNLQAPAGHAPQQQYQQTPPQTPPAQQQQQYYQPQQPAQQPYNPQQAPAHNPYPQAPVNYPPQTPHQAQPAQQNYYEQQAPAHNPYTQQGNVPNQNGQPFSQTTYPFNPNQPPFNNNGFGNGLV